MVFWNSSSKFTSLHNYENRTDLSTVTLITASSTICLPFDSWRWHIALVLITIVWPKKQGEPPKTITSGSCNLIICLVKFLPSFLLIGLKWSSSYKEVKSWACHEFFFFFFFQKGNCMGQDSCSCYLLKIFFTSYLTKRQSWSIDVVLQWSGREEKGIRNDPRNSFRTKHDQPRCPSACRGVTGGMGEGNTKGQKIESFRERVSKSTHSISPVIIATEQKMKTD